MEFRLRNRGDLQGSLNSYIGDARDGMNIAHQGAIKSLEITSDTADAVKNTYDSKELNITHLPQQISNNQKLRAIAKHNPELAYAILKNMKLYQDNNDNKAGFNNSQNNQTYLNIDHEYNKLALDNNQSNNNSNKYNIIDTAFHEYYHTTDNSNNDIEEAFATYYGKRAKDLYQTYYNKDYKTNLLDSMLSYSNDNSFNIDSFNSYVDYRVGNTSSQQFNHNNQLARTIDQGSIEPYLMLAGKYRIPFTDNIKTPDGKDYDVHFGINNSILNQEIGSGTDGKSKSTLVIPQAGAGLYIYAIPSGENPNITISRGIRNTLSYDAIMTKEGGFGGGVTVGITISPPIPGNIAFEKD